MKKILSYKNVSFKRDDREILKNIVMMKPQILLYTKEVKLKE